MSNTKIIAAIDEAITRGAKPIDMPGMGAELVRSHAHVQVESEEVLEVLLKALESDGRFSLPEGTMISAGHGFYSFTYLSLTHRFAAERLNGGDVETFINLTAELFKTNTTPAIHVMSLLGVEVEGSVKLSPEISLVPIDSLPSSGAKEAALGKSTWQFHVPQWERAHAALVAEFQMSPVFIFGGDTASVQITNFNEAFAEARDLLCLCGLAAPVSQFLWAQLLGFAGTLPAGSSWSSSGPQTHFYGEPIKLDVVKAKHVCGKYFSLTKSKREKLHIPIRRLASAIREINDEDRAIDLGIALEALLLSDANAELSFRLALRGAWLVGQDKEQRSEIYSILKKLYEIRSQAVHKGIIDAKNLEGDLLTRGLGLCADLIVAVIFAGDEQLEWNKIVLG